MTSGQLFDLITHVDCSYQYVSEEGSAKAVGLGKCLWGSALDQRRPPCGVADDQTV